MIELKTNLGLKAPEPAPKPEPPKQDDAALRELRAQVQSLTEEVRQLREENAALRSNTKRQFVFDVKRDGWGDIEHVIATEA